MQRLESTQNASSESFSRSSTLSEHASTLLSERHSTQAGGKRELASASISFDSDVYGSAEKVGSCKRADDACSWRPDDSSSSSQTKTWRGQREAQRDKPLDTKDGKYEVKPGDTMNDISKRYLKDLGIESPSAKEIAGLSKMLAEQNKEQHSILKCNPNLIRPGMKLELPPTDKIQGLMPKAEVYGSMSPDFVPPSGSWKGGEMDLPDNRLSVPNRPGRETENYIDSLPNSDLGRAGEAGNGLICRREDGFANFPEQFMSPKGLIDHLESGWYRDVMKLPFNFHKDAPGTIMNLPFRPSEDSPGKMMTLEYRIANTISSNGSNDSQNFLKRMLDHVPLPEVMLV